MADVVLAVHELVANAVEHGGVGEDDVTVDVEVRGGALQVVVRHPGAPFTPFTPRPPAPGGAERGRGLELARALVDDLEHRAGPSGHAWHLTIVSVLPLPT